MSLSSAPKSFHADRARAGRPMLERRGEVGEHRRQLGKVGLAGAERRRARTVEAGEAVLDVRGVVGAALLAVIDDVEPAVDLLRDHLGDGAAHRVLRARPPRAPGCFCSASMQLHHLGRPRQAAGMGGENSSACCASCMLSSPAVPRDAKRSAAPWHPASLPVRPPWPARARESR